MNIHEYQGKSLLKRYGVAVQEGIVADTPEQAVESAKQLTAQTGTEWYVVKAQIHAGGRGKGIVTETGSHGVVLAKGLDKVADIAKGILGGHLVTKQTGKDGKIVSKVLIAQDVYYPGEAQTEEFYMSVLMIGKNYNLKLTAKDRQGNVKEVDFIIEVLNITNVGIKLGDQSAEITWQTSRPTATAIEYGVSTKYEIKINESKTYHKLAINDLLLGQNKYHFRIKAEEKTGISYSIDYDFQTLANNPTYYNDEGFWRNVGGETASVGASETIAPVKDVTQVITPEVRGETLSSTESGNVKGLSDDNSQSSDSFSDIILYILLISGLGSLVYLKKKELVILGKNVYPVLIAPFKTNNKLNKTIDSAIEEEIKKKNR